MTGAVEGDEESVFLFVREKVTVYLSGEQNWRENQAERDRCCIISFDVTSDSSLSRMPCDVSLLRVFML